MITLSEGNLITLVLSLLATVNHVYAGFTGLAGSRESRMETTAFFILAMGAGWYAFWVGLLGAGAFENHPRLVGVSMLISGYTAPALFIFTLSITRPREGLPRKYFALLGFGLLGTAFAFITYFAPDTSRELWRLYKEGRLHEGGLPGLIYFLHTGELLIFFILSLVVVVRIAFSGRAKSEARVPARVILIAIIVGLLALSASNIVPHILPSLGTIRFGPIATIPVIFMLRYSLLNSRKMLAELEQTRVTERMEARRGLAASLREARYYRRRFLGERERVAAEVHDSVGAALTRLIMELESTSGLLTHQPRIIKALRDILGHLRELVQMLGESREGTLEQDLRGYIENIRAARRFAITDEIGMSERTPGVSTRFQVQRIFAEIMTNIIRHSRAERIRVIWRPGPVRTWLLVSDDGKGIQDAERSSGFGLGNMRRRAVRLRGRLFILRGRPAGTIIALALPADAV